MKVNKIGIVGVGNWGENLVRNFCDILGGGNVFVSDQDRDKLRNMKNKYPGVSLVPNFDNLISNDELRVVVISTPAQTHFRLAKKALERDNHVLVEKPISLEISQAINLIKLAEEKGKVIMVDHLLEYHPAIEEMEHLIDSGKLGNIYYAYGQRVNLGVVRTEENALWSLGPHDISVLLYLLKKEPTRVSAGGGIYLQENEGIEDVVFLNLEFEGGLKAHTHLSWLDPHKIRKMTIVGSEKMVVFDDMESTDKLKIFDKGVQRAANGRFNVRYGDVHVPNIELEEPLKKMCHHFLDCIENGKQPRSDGYDGLRVLKVLDAAQRSLDNNGEPMPVMNVEL